LLSKTSRLAFWQADTVKSGDGRSFSFHIEHRSLVVEVYRPRLASPVPQAEDVVARSVRSLVDIDLTDERSLTAAVRDSSRTRRRSRVSRILRQLPAPGTVAAT